MGMAASQVRFLQLTHRKNDIGVQLTTLANQKVSLSRDMQKVSRDYNNALSQKVLKWSNNQGVSYVDLSYQNLMKPSAMNQNKPYLLTDRNGRVVVDNQYVKYAKMISPDGKPGGNWDGVKSEIIANLCGFNPGDVERSQELQEDIWRHEFFVEDIKNAEPMPPVQKGGISSLLSYVGMTSTGVPGGGFINNSANWAAAYDSNDAVYIGNTYAKGNLELLMNTIYDTISPFLEDSEKDVLMLACDAFQNSNLGFVDCNDSETEKKSLEAEHTAVGGNATDGYSVNVSLMLEELFAKCSKTVTDNGTEVLVWLDKNSSEYGEWETAHADWQSSYDTAVAHCNSMVAERSELFTAEQETLIAFYDNIFSSIAEKGWVHNEQVNNTEYLNQMMQNNMYTMTVTDRSPVTIQSDEVCIDCGQELTVNIKTRKLENKYSTDIASNFSQIFFVNDSDLREQALVEYEYEKNIINQKESRIDTRMQDLKTEQSAINQMLQGLDKVKSDNIERTMNIFG